MKKCKIELKLNGKVFCSQWLDASRPISDFVTIQQLANKSGWEFNIVEYR